MIDVHPTQVLLGLAAIGAAIGAGMRLQPASSSVQDLLDEKSAGTDLTYRQASSAATADLDLSPEAVERRRDRRRRIEQMLGVARENVQEGLDEAIQDGDTEGVKEYSAMLAQLEPLPDDISLSTSSEADYRRWLDDKSLRY